MPAIQPARLRKQASDLAGKFDQPALFVRDLHSLLDLYTDHTHRPGLSGEPSPLIAMYKTPPQVIGQVWRELLPLIHRQPTSTLFLCDALWAEPNYDLQLLAARLLGQVPVNPPDPVVDRLNSWVWKGFDSKVLEGLFEFGIMRLQQEAPGTLLGLVSDWVGSSTPHVQQAGLLALLPIIKQSGSENLPPIFRMLAPFLRTAPPNLRPEILMVLSALAHSSPSESAYLLRQSLSSSDNPDTAWFIRKVLNDFPADIQIGLQKALKER